MNHQHVSSILEQFLDGSLCAVERWAVIAHLDECASCRDFAAGEARLRGQLRELLEAGEPAPGLSGRLQVALDNMPDAAPVRRLPAFPVIDRLRLALVVGPALAALWLIVQVSVSPAVATLDLPRELAASHAIFAQDESLLDVAGEPDAVSSWFRETVGLAVDAPALEGYSLMGGRLIVLNGSPVAQLVYETADDRYLSLLTFKAGGDGIEAMTLTHRGTISTATWPAAGQRVALIGEMPDAALLDLAESLSDWPDTAIAAS